MSEKKTGEIGIARNLTKEILTIQANNPKLTHKQIAELVNCHKSNIYACLKRHGIKSESVNDFREARAQILSGYQDKILKSITVKDYKKANLKDKTIAFSILYDKERLETNQATNITQFSQIVELIDKDKPIKDAEFTNEPKETQ